MQFSVPNSLEEVGQLYKQTGGQKTIVQSLFDALANSGKYEYAEHFIRLACAQYPDQIWPYVKLLFVLSVLGRTQDTFSISAQIIKYSRSLDVEQIDSLALEIYRTAKLGLLSENLDAMSVLLKLAMGVSPYGKKIISSVKQFAPMSYEEFESKVIDSSEEFKNATIPLPRVLERVSGTFPSYVGAKVLCIFREHAYTGKGAREVEFLDFYQKTAQQAGIDYKAFPSDKLIHTNSATPEEFNDEIDKLEQVIATWKPEYVYIDNFLAYSNQDYVTLAHDKLAEFKDKYAFKLISFYADAWAMSQKNALERANDIVDAHHHTQSSYIGDFSEEIERKVLCFPCPYPKDLFSYPEIKKDIFCAFHGTLHDIRVPWLAKIKEDKLGVKLHYSQHSVDSELCTTEAYAKAISRYKISLIFSARNTLKTTITGSIWEALLTGSMILEEESLEVSDYLVPYVHYVPFISYSQMKAAITYLEKNEGLLNLITQNATSLFDEYYNAERFWSLLLHLADKGNMKL